MKLEFSRQCFDKYSNAKSRENPSSGSRVFPCGQTDMTKLKVAFRNFANAPTKKSYHICEHFYLCVHGILQYIYSKRVPDDGHVGRKS